MMNETQTLLPAFQFRVRFKGLKGAEADSGFQSISGLKITKSMLPGENKTGAAQFNPLILRRAVSGQDSVLRQWVVKSLQQPSYKPVRELLIEVLNEEHKPGMIFRLTHITVAGWELGELNAGESKLLMEEITLNYRSVELVT